MRVPLWEGSIKKPLAVSDRGFFYDLVKPFRKEAVTLIDYC